MLTTQECYVLIHYLPNFGPASCDKLLNHYGDLLTALCSPAEQLRGFLTPDALSVLQACLQQGDTHPLMKKVRRIIVHCQSQGIHLISREHADYPLLLGQTVAAPCLLYVRGDASVLSMPQVAIVGSRKPSIGGAKNARSFAAQLNEAGICVTSGLALGIDIEAHLGALQARGKTIAVFGTGIDTVYPKRHEKIALDILNSGGALVSEFPLGTAAYARNFPRRNRIVSGLCLGVLVVEAAIKSGSTITARYAVEHNREVFAIPGSIHNALSRGCHLLIKEGAALVESAQDIMTLLNLSACNYQAPRALDNSPEVAKLEAIEVSVFECLGPDPISIDEISLATGIDIVRLSASLLNLELKGFITQSGSMYMRI